MWRTGKWKHPKRKRIQTGRWMYDKSKDCFYRELKMNKRRIFPLTKGYCPVCEKYLFFANLIGLSARCPECKTFISNIFKEDYFKDELRNRRTH
jgi:phage FluMu protein Com